MKLYFYNHNTSNQTIEKLDTVLQSISNEFGFESYVNLSNSSWSSEYFNENSAICIFHSIPDYFDESTLSKNLKKDSFWIIIRISSDPLGRRIEPIQISGLDENCGWIIYIPNAKHVGLLHQNIESINLRNNWSELIKAVSDKVSIGDLLRGKGNNTVLSRYLGLRNYRLASCLFILCQGYLSLMILTGEPRLGKIDKALKCIGWPSMTPAGFYTSLADNKNKFNYHEYWKKILHSNDLERDLKSELMTTKLPDDVSILVRWVTGQPGNEISTEIVAGAILEFCHILND